MIKFVIKSFLYMLGFIILFPVFMSAYGLYDAVDFYQKAELIEGKVDSCYKVTGKNIRPSSNVVHTSYMRRIKTNDDRLINGNFGYPSKSICESTIGEEIKVLKHKNDLRVYTFVDYFLPPIAISIIPLFVIFIILRTKKYYKEKSIKLSKQK